MSIWTLTKDSDAGICSQFALQKNPKIALLCLLLPTHGILTKPGTTEAARIAKKALQTADNDLLQAKIALKKDLKPSKRDRRRRVPLQGISKAKKFLQMAEEHAKAEKAKKELQVAQKSIKKV